MIIMNNVHGNKNQLVDIYHWLLKKNEIICTRILYDPVKYSSFAKSIFFT
jgi:hypothetical protein